MINLKKLKSQLTVNDIVHLVKSIGGELYQDNSQQNNQLIFYSCCHHITPMSHKPKLYYYIDTQSFFCYSCSSAYDIISLIEARWKLENKQFNFYDIISYIGTECHIDIGQFNRVTTKTNCGNWKSILDRYDITTGNINANKIIDKNILELFTKVYPQEWCEEGISVNSMEKYGIRYYSRGNQTIIPCYNMDNNLVGIRVRNWEKNDSKYNSLKTLDRIDYKCNTNQLFYGLNYNKYAIEHYKKCVLVESEKAVLQSDTWFGHNSYTIGMFGNALNNFRRDLLLQLDIETVIYAPDYDYKDLKEFKSWYRKQKKLLNKLHNYVNIEVIMDCNNEINYKDNAFDIDKETYLKLYQQRMKYIDWINYCEAIIK